MSSNIALYREREREREIFVIRNIFALNYFACRRACSNKYDTFENKLNNKLKRSNFTNALIHYSNLNIALLV